MELYQLTERGQSCDSFSVCLHVYDGTCLINNMIPHSRATFKEDLCALQHMHLLVFAYTIFKQISLKTFMWFYVVLLV